MEKFHATTTFRVRVEIPCVIGRWLDWRFNVEGQKNLNTTMPSRRSNNETEARLQCGLEGLGHTSAATRAFANRAADIFERSDFKRGKQAA